MYYFFEPLMEDGKQVVRRPEEDDEWFDFGDGPYRFSVVGKYPLLTMKKFEQDPFGKIRELWSKFKNVDIGYPVTEEEKRNSLLIMHEIGVEAWQAISETMKLLEEGIA